MAQHRTSSSGYVSKQLEAISLAKLLSISFPRYFFSFSVRTTHVQAIRYDWLDPRFRTNHFIKAPVLNKPAFDYSPRATLSLSSLIPSPSFAPTDRIVSLHRRTNYLVVYPAATDHRLIASHGETKSSTRASEIPLDSLRFIDSTIYIVKLFLITTVFLTK